MACARCRCPRCWCQTITSPPTRPRPRKCSRKPICLAIGWPTAASKTLADLNKDAVVFESGMMAIKGNEKLKAGMILAFKRGMGNTEVMSCYAHTVSHEFVPFTGLFRTHVQFDRGTGWAKRASGDTPLYIQEIDAGGAIQ